MTDGQFTRSFFGMIGGLVLWTIILMFLARIVTSELQASLDEERITARGEALAATVVNAGEVTIGVSNDAADNSTQVAAADQSPESMYNVSCAACHASGAAGAPILGDVGQWASRISKGKQTLYDSAINGIGAMPAKGGASLSDEAVRSVVDYMVSHSQ